MELWLTIMALDRAIRKGGSGNTVCMTVEGYFLFLLAKRRVMQMGLFIKYFFKARDKPQNRTIGKQLQLLFGGTTSGKPVNEHTAMQ